MRIEQFSASPAGAPRVDARLRQDAGIAFGPDAQLQILQLQGHEVVYSRDMSATLPVAWLPLVPLGLGVSWLLAGPSA